MKARNFLFLLVAAAVLGLWAYRSVDSERKSVTPARMGQTVFDNLPVNDVAVMEITTSATNTVIKREDQQWKVASRYDYPAKFNKIAETLLELRELKVGQIIPGGRERPGEFKLLEPAAEGVPSDQTGTRLELRDDAGRVLVGLLIGKHFMTQPARGDQQAMMFGAGGYPSGHYVKTAEGTVMVVGRTLDRMIEPATSWLADDFISVPSADIRELTVTGPGRAPVAIKRDMPAGRLLMAGMDPAEGEADTGKLNQMAGALNYLNFQDVADPALGAEETGLDEPVVFIATTADGYVYTFNIGKKISATSNDRFVGVSVSYTAPAPDTTGETGDESADAEAGITVDHNEKARALNEKLSSWTYILRSFRLDNMLLERAQLITSPEKEDEETSTAATTE